MKDLIRQHLAKVYRALALTDPTISVLFTDNEAIQDINARWRQIDEPTDVLSFPAHRADAIPDDPAHLGDIIISVPYAEGLVGSGEHTRRVAQELGQDPDTLQWALTDEVAFLFIHGLLHLLGYDHGNAEEEAQMRQMERRLWETMTQ